MKKSNDRVRRIADLVKKELAQILLKEAIDPRLRFVTITAVKLSPDYSIATIYVVAHDNNDTKTLIQILNESAKDFRHHLARKVNMRTTPKLKFVYDDSIDYSRKMSKLIDEATSRLRDEDEEK